MIQGWRSEGLSLMTIASRLTELGHTTRRGKTWNYILVASVLKRGKASQ
jgi:hypothetical protein